MLLERSRGLTYPILDLLMSVCGQSSESHSANFLDFVCPCQFTAGSDAAVQFQQGETEPCILLHRSNSVKTKPLARNVQHDATIVGFDVNVGKLLHCGPRNEAAFRR